MAAFSDNGHQEIISFILSRLESLKLVKRDLDLL
jgi:hypothetical protein